MSTPAPAVRIDVDGTVTVLADNTYESIKGGIGGWIESIPTDGRLTIFVDEEGKVRGLGVNPLGEALWAEVDGYGCLADGTDWMVGPCVVTGPPDADGDCTAVPDWVLPKLAELALARGLGAKAAR